MNYRKQSVIVFACKVVGAVLTFFAIAIYAQLVNSEDLGSYFLLVAVMSLAGISSDLGVSGSLEKRLGEGSNDNTGGLITTGLLVQLSALSVVISGILLFKSGVNSYLGAGVADILIVILIVSQTSRTLQSILRGNLMVAQSEVINLLRKIFTYISSITFILLGFKLEGMLYGLIIGLSFPTLYILYSYNIGSGVPTWAHFRSLWSFSKYEFINQIGGRLYNWLDVLIIGLLLTSTAVSGYELAWRVAVLVSFIGRTFSATLFPHISQWFENQDIHLIRESLNEAISIGLYVSIPAFIGVLFLANEIMVYVFGPNYAFSQTALLVLVFGQVFQSIQPPISRALQGINEQRLSTYITILSIILNVLLNLLLIPFLHITGAAIATTISALLSTALHTYYVKRKLGISYRFSLLKSSIFGNIVLIVLLVTIQQIFKIRSIEQLITVISLAVIIYTLSTFFFEEPRRLIIPIIKR